MIGTVAACAGVSAFGESVTVIGFISKAFDDTSVLITCEVAVGNDDVILGDSLEAGGGSFEGTLNKVCVSCVVNFTKDVDCFEVVFEVIIISLECFKFENKCFEALAFVVEVSFGTSL